MGREQNRRSTCGNAYSTNSRSHILDVWSPESLQSIPHAEKTLWVDLEMISKLLGLLAAEITLINMWETLEAGTGVEWEREQGFRQLPSSAHHKTSDLAKETSLHARDSGLPRCKR